MRNGSFLWHDYALGSAHESAYQQWGSYLPDNTTLPTANHSCVVANHSESLASGAWGWTPSGCSEHRVFICKIIRGWRRPRRSHYVLLGLLRQLLHTTACFMQSSRWQGFERAFERGVLSVCA